MEPLYSRPSLARTLMAGLPQLFQTHSSVPRKNPIAWNNLGWFSFYIEKSMLCVLIRIASMFTFVLEKLKEISLLRLLSRCYD